MNTTALDYFLEGQKYQPELTPIQETYIDEAEESGLTFTNIDEFGQPNFIGTIQQWKRFEDKLLFNPFYDNE